MNREGIMEDSVLIITINGCGVELSNMNNSVKVYGSKNSIKLVETKPFKFSNKELAETLNMYKCHNNSQIKRISDVISICLISIQGHNNEEIMGEGNINLEHLKDQKKHEESIVIRDRDGKVVTQLYLTLQWMYSRVKFLEDTIKVWEATLNKDKADMQKLESIINDLRAPFQEKLEEVVQSLSLQHQIYLTYQMYPGIF